MSGSPIPIPKPKVSIADHRVDVVLTPPRPQDAAPVGAMDPALPGVVRRAKPLRAGDTGQLLVLSYHQVFPDEPTPVLTRYSVTASQLLLHLTLLRALGFRPLRLADVLGARSLGRAMPPRSVLITFDDGTLGQWTHAD